MKKLNLGINHKILFLIMFASVLFFSAYENNILPILTMAIGIIAGPLGCIIGGALGIILILL